MNAGVDPAGVTGPVRAGWGVPVGGTRIGPVGLSLIGFTILAVASWGFILFGGDSGFQDLFSGETWSRARDWLGQLVGKGSGVRPAFLDLGEWAHAGVLASQTLAMSILAISFAGAGVLLTFLPAARNVATGELAPTRRGSLGWKALYFGSRGVFVFLRGVPELVWAMIIVFFLSPGILPGALALGLHNYGILGKLSAELVEDVDMRPARALRASGAGGFQMLAYAILPQIMPQFTTYLLYRWEVVIRTTIVVGFVSTGGLGRDFRLSMSFFHYTDVALLLIWYVILVIGVDLLCVWLRGLVRPPQPR